MSVLTGKPSSVTAGVPSASITLSFSDLLTEMGLGSDPFWSVAANIEKAVFALTDATGSEVGFMEFEQAGGSFGTAVFSVDATARQNSWVCTRVTLHDFQGGSAVMLRSAFPTPAEFDIDVAAGGPSDLLTNLFFWATADAGLTLSGSRVTQLIDQIGGVVLTSGTGPTYQAAGFNGQPTLNFANNAAETLASGNFTSPFAAQDPFSIYAVLDIVGAGGFQCVAELLQGAEGSAGGNRTLFDWQSGSLVFDPNSSGPSKSLAQNTKVVANIIYAGGTASCTMKVNGLAGSAVNVQMHLDGASMKAYLGNFGGLSLPLDGLLSQYRVYTVAHNPTDEAQIVNFLRNKYGI